MVQGDDSATTPDLAFWFEERRKTASGYFSLAAGAGRLRQDCGRLSDILQPVGGYGRAGTLNLDRRIRREPTSAETSIRRRIGTDCGPCGYLRLIGLWDCLARAVPGRLATSRDLRGLAAGVLAPIAGTPPLTQSKIDVVL